MAERIEKSIRFLRDSALFTNFCYEIAKDPDQRSLDLVNVVSRNTTNLANLA